MVTKVKTSYTAQHKAAQAKPAAKLKPTIVIEDVTPKPAPTEKSIHDDVEHLFAKYGVSVPSSTRVFTSYVASFCVGLGIGYIGSIILETLVIAAMMLTGSTFFAMAMYIVGFLAMLYASYKTGGWVGEFILSGNIDRCYQKCSNTVRGFFAFRNREVTA